MRLGLDEFYGSVPGIDMTLATVYDQDIPNMTWQQEGMAGSSIGAENLGNFQEVIIHHIHQNIDRYLERDHHRTGPGEEDKNPNQKR